MLELERLHLAKHTAVVNRRTLWEMTSVNDSFTETPLAMTDIDVVGNFTAKFESSDSPSIDIVEKILRLDLLQINELQVILFPFKFYLHLYFSSKPNIKSSLDVKSHRLSFSDDLAVVVDEPLNNCLLVVTQILSFIAISPHGHER